MPDQVPAAVVAERYARLVALVEQTALTENQALVGQQVEVLVADGEGRKDDVTHRMSGRARDNRLVHLSPGEVLPRPGDLVMTTVTAAAPHYLLADGAVLSVRRTAGGDAWQSRQEADVPWAGSGGGPVPVLLGMPAVRS
jgi:tRNA-2-methylthio-N6-dimethylallyladenosine synthase